MLDLGKVAEGKCHFRGSDPREAGDAIKRNACFTELPVGRWGEEGPCSGNYRADISFPLLSHSACSPALLGAGGAGHGGRHVALPALPLSLDRLPRWLPAGVLWPNLCPGGQRGKCAPHTLSTAPASLVTSNSQ